MKHWVIIFFLLWGLLPLSAQDIPSLPIPLGAGSAEVYNNQIYYFGGSNNWSGSVVYDSVFVYDGTSWALESIIPDKNLWDVETVLVGNEVYLISGWPSGPRLLRKYNLDTKVWTYLAESPNNTTWGVAAEYWNGFIYLFEPNGNVYEYSIQNNEWVTKTNAGVSSPLNLSSIIYENSIYVIGYNDSTFQKYDPANDVWTQLSNSLYQVGASAMSIINNLIYNVGGNVSGGRYAEYKSVLVYNVSTDSWALDSLEISSKRHWMATAGYEGGLYVLGGIDSTSNSVDIVEEIVPRGTATAIADSRVLYPGEFYLSQNYPNPFNPSTTIRYNVAKPGKVQLRIYDVAGQQVATLVSKQQAPGDYSVSFNAGSLSSGVYFYTLESSAGFSKSYKMILMK